MHAHTAAVRHHDSPIVLPAKIGWQATQRILVSGPFLESWTADCRAIIDDAAE